MGYGYYRYVRSVTNGVRIYRQDGGVLLDVTKATNDTTVKGGGATTGDILFYPNVTDTTPAFKLKGTEEMDLILPASKSIRGYWNAVKHMDVQYASNKLTFEGGFVAGDDFAFGVGGDTYPYLLLYGGEHVHVMLPAGKDFSVRDDFTKFFTIKKDTDAVIQSEEANQNIYLNPNGTGNVKFGTHAAITTETNSGYIEILDAAGNTRKLCVVS